MKKVVLFTVIIAICLSAFAAEDPAANLTSAQRIQYLSEALSVQATQYTDTNTIGGSSFFSRDFAITSSSSLSRTYMDWDAYKGYSQISKYDFFTLVGADDLAAKCREIDERVALKHRQATSWFLTGTALTVGGCVLLFTQMDKLSEMNEGKLTVLLSLGTAACIIPFCIGYDLSRYDERLDVSTEFALGLAENYNLQLAAKISVGL